MLLLTACLYPCLAGPAYWGMQSGWKLCSTGHLQSPVDIVPEKLLFDPELGKLNFRYEANERRLGSESATLTNTGQLVVMSIGPEEEDNALLTGMGRTQRILVMDGPLHYNYTLDKIVFHFGESPSKPGSEHTLNGIRFVGELQIYGYNSDLYKNFTAAMMKPNGLLAISVLVDFLNDKARQMKETTNEQLADIAAKLAAVVRKDQSIRYPNFTPLKLLPDTTDYVTYQGSLTFPGCYETVTWILLNKPVYIQDHTFKAWTELNGREDERKEKIVVPNFRKIQPLNGRLLRTNINFKGVKSDACPTMEPGVSYKMNSNFIHLKKLRNSEDKKRRRK